MKINTSLPTKKVLKNRCWKLGLNRDPCVREMIGLYERFGHRAFELAPKMQKILFRPEPKISRRVGTPTKWSDMDLMYAWLACERVWRFAKGKDPTISLSKALKNAFKWPEKSPWTIIVQGGTRAIKNAATARRLHSRGQQLHLAKSEKYREYWEKLVQC